MLIKKGKITLRERIECLTHGGKKPLDPASLEETSLSRRDFLGQAAAVTAASVLVPNTLGLLDRNLYAADCPPIQAGGACGNYFPIFEYSMPGGGNMVEDIMCVTRDHQPISSGSRYENFGHPIGRDFNNLSPITPFAGIPFHPDSPFLWGFISGLNSVAGGQAPTILSHMAGACIAVATSSDTDNNPLSVMKGMVALGIQGHLAKTGITHGDSVNNEDNGGMRHAQAFKKYRASAVRVSNVQGAQNLTGVGRLFTELGPTRAQEVLSAINKLSDGKINQFSNLSLSAQVETLVRCGFLNAKEIPSVFNPQNIFPSTIPVGDPLLAAFPGGNIAVRAPGPSPTFVQAGTETLLPGGNINRDGSTSTAAVLSRLLADCTSMHAHMLGVGNYDNHDNTNINPSRRRAETGVRLAQIMYYAHLRQRPLFFVILTAGGMGVTRDDAGRLVTDPATGRALHPGDSDNNAGIFCFLYHPAKLGSEMLKNVNYWQVGEYGTGGVNRNYAVGGDQTKAAQLLFDLWAQLHGLEAKARGLQRDDPFSANENLYRMFNKIM